MNKNLREHASANCFVRIYDDVVEFISYTTKVISMKQDENKNRIIECTGTYSPTTRRQIGWFLKEYAPDLTYYDIKGIAGKGYVII